MSYDPADLAGRVLYQLLIGTVAPRPIAWVSTRDKAGVLNLAPFSYFTVAATRPLTLLFCPQVQPDGQGKDTLRNIQAVPEFVINLPDEATAEAMNLTSGAYPAGVSEFDVAGLAAVASETISVPRVAAAPMAFECRLREILTIADRPGGGSAVFGEVSRIHVREGLMEVETGRIDIDRYRPIGRWGGNWYTRQTDRFEMPRPEPGPR